MSHGRRHGDKKPFHQRILDQCQGGDIEFLHLCGIDPDLTAEEVADALLPEPESRAVEISRSLHSDSRKAVVAGQGLNLEIRDKGIVVSPAER